MATIAASSDVSVLKVNKFLGLNENRDGSTTLKVGEFSQMRNFKITNDYHLQIRPGTKTILNLAGLVKAEGKNADGERLHGVWRGAVKGTYHILAAYAGFIFDVNVQLETAKKKGQITEADTSFFAFGGKVYMLNGNEYKSWDGEDDTQFEDVVGYVPVIQTATNPEGSGTLLEGVNRLTNQRRVQFSPNGTATNFQLPEKDILSVEEVRLNDEATSAYTVDKAAGVVKMNSAPPTGTNTLEVRYSKGDADRKSVTSMRYSELYNGSSDSRVFLYGDGSNKAIYSGVNYETTQPTADYFPDLYEIAVGESNTPITALVRHYSKMMAYKPNSAWSIQYGTLALEDKSNTAAFYCTPVNRQFGNEAMGQVRLLENNPLTIDVNSIYRWKTSGGYIGNNENNAQRISDRVISTLDGFDMKKVKTYNLKAMYEYWFVYGSTALILNYANDVWYKYVNLPFVVPLDAETEEYGFAQDGRVVHFSRQYRNDDGAPIDCYAATGAMDFGKDYLLKYSPHIFVAMKPESNARITVSVETNKRSDYPEKVVAYSLSTFLNVDFRHFSFATNRQPQVKRVKLKVKKATFYRLIFKSLSVSATATVLETDVQLRFAGSVK